MALDFPSSPVNGQVYDNFIYDAAKGTWKSLSSGASPNYLVNPTISNAVITATASTPSTIPLTINGAASQSANLQEWKDSAGIVLADIDSAGKANFETGANAVNIKASAGVNHGYMAFYTENTTPTTRTGYFGFGSNGTTTMTIANERSSGVISLNASSVRIPNQPSFLATKSDNGNTYSGDYVFNIAMHNTGGHYSTSTGRFTAPVAGRYYFVAECQIYGIGGGTLSTVSFKKNGTLYMDSSGGTPKTIVNKAGDSTYHNTIVLAMVIDCAANDYISVFTENTRGMQSHFSGYLIG